MPIAEQNVYFVEERTDVVPNTKNEIFWKMKKKIFKNLEVPE